MSSQHLIKQIALDVTLAAQYPKRIDATCECGAVERLGLSREPEVLP